MTLFPDTVNAVLHESIIGRAAKKGIVEINCVQIRDFTENKQRQVDDYPYGGGWGCVMMAQPLKSCLKKIMSTTKGERSRVIYMSPQGKPYTQETAKRLSRDYDHLVLVCGHYEGVDERFIEQCVDEEISLGDFVLTGGEIAAMAVADAVSRLVPGVLSDPECFENESHWNGLLEYPQYSRPEVWHGRAVPPELLTGDHARVERWRRKQSLLRTRQRRPDLYDKLDLSSREDQKLLSELERELSRPVLPRPVECRPAREEDLDAMDAILVQAKARLIPIGQWNGAYPAREDFVSDMARGECHVLTCGGAVGGFFTLSTQPEAGYADITDGKWSSDEPYAVIHRCAVAEQWQGTGLADQMVEAWQQLALERGVGWLRVDTYRKNKAMLGLIRRNGFQYRGNVLVDVPPPHDPRRVAYEKKLKGAGQR